MTERRDTRRNREALVRAARETFISVGMGAPIKAIARAAGLGSATVYRHFPTRPDLVAAVCGNEIARCRVQLAETRDIVDPWDGLRRLLMTVAETEAAMPGLATPPPSTGAPMTDYDAMWAEAREVVAMLRGRLLGHGDVRSDVSSDDLWLLISTVRAATIARRPTWQRDIPRLIDLMLDGLRSR